MMLSSDSMSYPSMLPFSRVRTARASVILPTDASHPAKNKTNQKPAICLVKDEEEDSQVLSGRKMKMKSMMPTKAH